MKLVIVHENAELVKWMRKPKGSKWAKDVQEKEKKRDTEPISRKINDHVRSLGKRINGRPKEAQQD